MSSSQEVAATKLHKHLKIARQSSNVTESSQFPKQPRSQQQPVPLSRNESLTSSGTFSFGTYVFDTKFLISSGHMHHLKLNGSERLKVDNYVQNQLYQCVPN